MARANEDPSMSSWKRTCNFRISRLWPHAMLSQESAQTSKTFFLQSAHAYGDRLSMAKWRAGMSNLWVFRWLLLPMTSFSNFSQALQPQLQSEWVWDTSRSQSHRDRWTGLFLRVGYTPRHNSQWPFSAKVCVCVCSMSIYFSIRSNQLQPRPVCTSQRPIAT